MELTVRHAWKKEADLSDLVRIHESHRGGIENDKVCKVTALTDNGTGSTPRYVVVKGQGTGFCDLSPNFLVNHYSEIKEMYVSLGEPEQSLEYIKNHDNEQSKAVKYFVGSIFMNGDTRKAFHVDVNKAYQFELEEARLLGNFLYLARHPDRYAKSLAWAGGIGLVLALLGFSLKDWIVALFSTPNP
jgi:hypothetical protein